METVHARCAYQLCFENAKEELKLKGEKIFLLLRKESGSTSNYTAFHDEEGFGGNYEREKYQLEF